MKHLFTLALLVPLTAGAQSLVSHLPQQRTVVLEDYTGINCQYCPDGHTIMESIRAADPQRVVLIAIHAGGFAVPSGSQPDFRTPWGNAMNSYFGVSGYPSGVINRRTFDGVRTLGRGAWQGASQQVLNMSSPVNLGMRSSFDATTREATIEVEYYYTADSPGGSDRLNVVLTEDHIIAPQVSTTTTFPNYDHKHVLRGNVTPTWGDTIEVTTTGSTAIRTYTYTIPAGWNADNCVAVAFIGEHQNDQYQARAVSINGGTTLLTGNLQGPDDAIAGASSSTTASFDNTFSSLYADAASFNVELTTVEAPAGWASSYSINGNSFTEASVVEIAGLGSTDIEVEVSPNATGGIGRYRLVVSSVQDPGAVAHEQFFTVISGVTDLVVTNPAAEAIAAEPRYLGGLADAENTGSAKLNRDEFIQAHADGLLPDLVNIYKNVSWTFPSLTDAEVATLSSLMDNGINLMIAGQDIGWDQSGASGAYGTAATQAFFTNYMHATFVNDGSTTNNPVNFNDDDLVFGALANGNIANVFAGNTYPEQITPIAPATEIFRYGNTTRIGGIRAQTANYKLVYLGVGPEQFADAAIGRKVVELSHDWFYGLVSVNELSDALGRLGQPYPVPADGQLTVPFALDEAAVLEVIDATGRLVISRNVAANTPQVVLNTAALVNGVYALQIRTNTGKRAVRNVVIAH